MDDKIKIFISHISEEQIEANKAKQYLDQVFKEKVEVFVASSWTSIKPGDDWFDCITGALEKCNIMLVLCSGDSVGRPWIQFETGAGWFAKKIKVIPICHKGMTPSALPEPIRRLQAVDINADTEGQQLHRLAQAVSAVATLPEPAAIPVESILLASHPGTTGSLKGWLLRPASHVGETLEGVFKVGVVDVADVDRSTQAGLEPNDAIFVKLYVEPPTGQFLNTIAHGKAAELFEAEDIEGRVVITRLKLTALYHGHGPESRPTPLILVEDAKLRPE